MGEGGGEEEKGRAFLSFSSLPFSLPSFPFSPETPDTQARFAEMAHDYVGADLAAVCKEAGLKAFKRCLAKHEMTSSLDSTVREKTLQDTRDVVIAAFAQVGPTAMREVAIDVPTVGTLGCD